MLTVLYRVSQWFSTVVLVIMVLLTVADIVLRSVFNSPIFGANEITNLMLCLSIGSGLVYSARNNGHIKVDLLAGLLKKTLGNFYITFEKLVEVIGFFLFTSLLAYYGYDAFLFEEHTAVLFLPVAPVYLVASAFGFVSILFLVFYKSSPAEAEGEQL